MLVIACRARRGGTRISQYSKTRSGNAIELLVHQGSPVKCRKTSSSVERRTSTLSG